MTLQSNAQVAIPHKPCLHSHARPKKRASKLLIDESVPVTADVTADIRGHADIRLRSRGTFINFTIRLVSTSSGEGRTCVSSGVRGLPRISPQGVTLEPPSPAAAWRGAVGYEPDVRHFMGGVGVVH